VQKYDIERVINIDLKLLRIIDELYKTRSVSHAAANLGLRQSTVSMSLAKLRDHFRDPLFVRTSRGMEPTPHAADLINILQEAEGLLQLALKHRAVFDPSISDRVFHVASRDIGQMRLVPPVMKCLRDVAPAIRIEMQSISEDTPKLLESGGLDLAVGFIRPMGAGFCHQTLFTERYVCIAREDHPRIRHELTLEQFQGEIHILVTTSGTGHSIVEQSIAAKSIRRKVGLWVPSFLGVDAIIASTDFLMILPRNMALIMAKSADIKVLELPFTLPTYQVMQHWHERYSQDPSNRWLRGIFADLFLEKQKIPARQKR
jgi:DNA-binding transcriptional LysR family regulator